MEDLIRTETFHYTQFTNLFQFMNHRSSLAGCFSTLHARIQTTKIDRMPHSAKRPRRSSIIDMTLAIAVVLNDQLRQGFDIAAIDEASVAPLPMDFYGC